MNSEHGALLTKTLELIATTRNEISQLREEIKLARNTVDRSQKLLARIEPSAPRVASRAKAL